MTFGYFVCNTPLRIDVAKLVVPMLSLFFIVFCCSPPQIPVWGFNPGLSMSDTPDLEKPVTVTMTFNTIVGKDHLAGRHLEYRTEFVFDQQQFELVEGELKTSADMGTGGEKRSVRIAVKSLRQTNNGQIQGRVSLVVDGTLWGYDWRELLIRVTDKGASWAEEPPIRNPGYGCSGP